MVSLEDRITELCKGSMLMSPIWLARLVEEIFDVSWIKRQAGGTTIVSENNQWPLLGSGALQVQPSSSSWSTISRSKTETSTIVRFLSPQGPLYTALRQSADAWVSVSFDSKLAQSDSVRIATGIATIMRQPKLAPSDMPYRPQSRNFDGQSSFDQSCMITLPVPHYFILRLIAYLMTPDVTEIVNKYGSDINVGFYQQMIAGQKFPIPSCIYSDLVDDYCDYLLTNARQLPGTTLVTSRSLCADLARLYIQAIADFWLSPYGSQLDLSSLSFSTNVSMPPPVLLQFVRRFLKRFFCHTSDEWCSPNTMAVRQTTFTSLKQPLLAFLHSCTTHWPLNTSFGNVVSCWRAVVLPWRAVKSFNVTTSSTNMVVWESFVSENVVFYSELLLAPLIMHLVRANIACPAYANAVYRLAKVFGGAPDTEALVKLLTRLSSTTCHHTSFSSSFVSSTATMSGYTRSQQTQFCFASPCVISAFQLLIAAIDSTVASPASTCSGSAKEMLRSAKSLLNEAFSSSTKTYEDATTTFNDSLNKTPSFSAPPSDLSFGRESGGRVPKFRRVPERQVSFTSFAKGDDKLLAGEPDFRSSDIPIVLRLQFFLGKFVETHDLLPKTGRAGAICHAARFRWMADRRELIVMGVFLVLSYFLFSSPIFYFLTMLYVTVRTFLAAIVTHLEEMVHGSGNRDQQMQQQLYQMANGFSDISSGHQHTN